MDLSNFIKKDIENFVEEMALDPTNLSLRTDGYIHSQPKSFPSNNDSPEMRARNSIELNNISNPESSVIDSSINVDDAVVPEDQVENYILKEDYDKEMAKAIDEGEYGKAKSILRHLKEKLHEYPKDSQERKEIKVLILELYEKYKSSLNDPDLTPNKINKQFVNTNNENSDEWGDVPLPINQNSLLNISSKKDLPQKELPKERLAIKKKLEEKKYLEQARREAQEASKKNMLKLHQEELLKEKARKQKLLEQKRALEKKKLAEESEKKILAKISLIEQLEKEKKYFEAVSAYESLKSSTLLEDLEPSRRITIFNDVKELYERLKTNLDKHYQEKMILNSHNSLKVDLLHLETEVAKLIVSQQLTQAISAYKKLLSFYKTKQKELPEDLRLLSKKKLQLYHDKIQLLLKENKRKHELKTREENNQKTLINKAVLNPLSNTEKLLLHTEEKKLKGRP